MLRRGRRQTEGNVLKHLDEDTAQPEGDEFAEALVGDGADDDFLATIQHLLDLNAIDLCVPPILAGVGENASVSCLDLRLGLQPNDHAARLCLVQDVGRDDFHDHRKPEPGSEVRSLLRRVGNTLLRHRDAIGIADALALGRGQRRSPFELYLV
jgi:hypothetical protein